MSLDTCEQRGSKSRHALQAAFSKSLTATPFIAAILTVVICAGPPGAEHIQASAGTVLPPVTISIGILLATWVILALLLHLSGRLAAELVNPASFYSLKTRLIDLEAAHQALCHNSGTEASQGTLCPRTNIQCAVGGYLASTKDELQHEGPRWMLGTGYSSIWEKLHRAEEALITLSSDEVVVTGAKMDKLRTTGSQMKNSHELCKELDLVIKNLTRVKAPCLPTDQELLAEDHAGDNPHASGAPCQVRELKLMASHIRQAINEFRDRQWAQLIRRRGELTAATTFTAFTVYILLWTAILWGATRDAILAGVTYFLIGGIVGLFNHIQIESDGSAGDSIDDFGASHARLFVTVLLSGLAALGGVVIVAILTLTQTGKIEPQVPTATLLAELLNIHLHPFNLIVALTFGLTPRLLIARLKAQADEAKGALKTTKAVHSDMTAASTAV